MTDKTGLPCVEVETGREPTASVIWLHGLGADGHDFEPIVPFLGTPADLPLRFVFPHAPRRPVTLNGGFVMRAWYDIRSLGFVRDEDDEGIRESAALIEDLIAAEKSRGFPANRIVIAGFSQGGAMACYVGLRHRETLAGLLVLSAYLLLPETLDAEAAPANRATPIFQCHGTADPVVPFEAGKMMATALEKQGYRVNWKTYPAEHSVHPMEVTDIGRWLVEVLGPSRNR